MRCQCVNGFISCRAADNINVNVVLPGAVNTPFTTRVLVRARAPAAPGAPRSTHEHLGRPTPLAKTPGPPLNPPPPNKQTDPAKLAYILDRIPLGRLAEPEDVVGPILFLASQ